MISLESDCTRIRVLLAIVCGAVVQSGWAQPVATGEAPQVVVTASRLGLAESAIGQHVAVFTREQIERENPASLGEFLARHAGGGVDRGSRSGGFGSLYLRGADPSHVVVLIDGVRQNDPLASRGSAVDLNTIAIDDVERIEIVRGNTSVVHGEALAGVVHIFTRASTAGSRARASVEAGGDGARAASAGFSRGPWHASVARREDGRVSSSGESRAESAQIGFRDRWGETSLRAQFRIAESRTLTYPDDSGGPRYAVIRALEARRSDAHQFNVQLDHDFAGRGTLGLQLSRFGRDSREDSPGVAPGVRDPFGLPPIVSDGEYRRTEAQLHWRANAGERWELLFGAQSRKETGRLDSAIFFGFWLPVAFRLERHTDSLFAEARRVSGPWELQLGVRHERTGGADSLNHPALSLQYRLPAGAGRVGAGWSSAGKLPSFYALGHPIVGNAQLKPERSRQAELFYATSANSPWRARVTVFGAEYRELVDFDAGPPPQLVNRARIRGSGLELNLQREWQGGVRAYLEGTAMSVRDPEGKVTLRYRPRRQASAGVEAPLGGRLWLRSAVTHLGRRFDSSVPTGDEWLPGNTTAQLTLSWRTPAWEIFATLDNAFGSGAEETIGTRVGGRRLRAGLRWRL